MFFFIIFEWKDINFDSVINFPMELDKFKEFYGNGIGYIVSEVEMMKVRGILFCPMLTH